MMTRIAFTGDLHFDQSSRWDECQRIANWFADDCERRQVDVIALGGDIFERRPTPTETRVVGDWLVKLANIAPVIGVLGNHEPPESLAIYNLLEARHRIRMLEHAGVVEVAGVTFGCLPWPRKTQLLKQTPDSHGGSEQALVEVVHETLRSMGTQLVQHDGPRVLLAHAMIGGATTSLGQPMVGCDCTIRVEDIQLAQADIALLSHIHKPQDWSTGTCPIGACPVVYAGSPRRTAFGEIEEKSYVLLHVDGRQLVKWERVPTPCTPMLLLESTWSDNGFLSSSWIDRNYDFHAAEVRWRYQVPAHLRDVAKRAARITEQELRAVGAVEVKIEEQVLVESKARSPEIALCKTLSDKLACRWDRLGFEPGAHRGLLEKARELEAQFGISRARAPGGVRLESFRARHFGVLDDFTLDLTQYGAAKLIALTGPNGAGKSTALCAALPGSMYRTFPDGRKIAEFATARDSLIEATIVNGRRMTLRHLLDGVNGKGESIALDEHGQNLVPAGTGKVREFDAWAADNLPSSEELLASTFCAQADAGFAGLTTGQRKAVLLRVLGIERYESMAAKAREMAREARGQVDTIEAQIADERARGGSVEVAQTVLTAARQRQAVAEEAIAVARQELATAESQIAYCTRAAEAVAARRTEREKVQQEQSEAGSKRADLLVRIGNNQAVLAGRAQIEAAIAEHGALTDRLAVSEPRLHAARIDQARLVAEHVAVVATEAALRQRRASLRELDRDAIGKAVALLPQLEADKARLEELVQGAEFELEQLRGKQIVGADTRIHHLRRGHEQISAADALSLATAIAEMCLSTDDETVQLDAAIPVRTKEAQDHLRNLKASLTAALSALHTTIVLADKAGELAASDATRMEILAELDAALTKRGEIQDRQRSVHAELAVLTNDRDAIEARLVELFPLSGKAERLATATARLAELEPQLTAVDAELAELADLLESRPAIPEPAPAPDRYAHEALVGTREREARDATAQTAVAEHRLEQAQQSAVRVMELTTTQRQLSLTASDWTRLGDDLGRDGLQADEIDCAGPELTEMANDLLHTCHGPRWTVEIRTVRDSADGKRQLDGCDIEVTDTIQGRVGEIATFSGGEKVLLGEAVSLAITMLGCQRAGVERPTLVRDETGAALDPENAAAYIGMLRRAAEIVEADRVLFVTHSEAVQEMADARIEIKTQIA